MATRKKRPRTVTITLLGVILIGVWSAAQVLAMTQQINLLLSLDIRPDPRLLLAISAGWSFLFLGSALALMRRAPFTRWLIPLLILLNALYELLLRALFVQTPSTAEDWLLRLLFYTVLLLFAWWSLNSGTGRTFLLGPQPASESKE